MSDFLDEREQARATAITNWQSPAPPLPKPEKRTMTPKAKPRKRFLSLPERQFRTVESISRRLDKRWPVIEATAAALGQPLLRASGSRDGSRSSDHPDPVGNLALQFIGQGKQIGFADIVEAVDAWLQQGIWIERHANAILHDNPEIAREAESTLAKSRCSEPVCTANVVSLGLCRKHWDELKAAQRAAASGE